MKIAFASSNGDTIDQHFGRSERFYLYEIDKEHFECVAKIDSSKKIEDEHEKLAYKIGSIAEADIVYSTQIGPTASKMVQSEGIYPVKTTEGERIVDAISKLQEVLRTSAPPWLLRIYYKSQGV